MSQTRPVDRFKSDALSEFWPCGKKPATFKREDRVRLLAEAFQALLAGRLPSRQAALFLGGAGMSWLTQGGDLEKDFLRVTKPKSHRTPSVLWREIQDAHRDERQADVDDDTIASDEQGCEP